LFLLILTYLFFYTFIYHLVSGTLSSFSDTYIYDGEVKDFLYYTLNISFSLPSYETTELIKWSSENHYILKLITISQVIVQYIIDTFVIGGVATIFMSHLFDKKK